MKRTLFSLTSLALFCCFIITSHAQQSAASLTGVVKDPNGAVISGAQVVATQNQTNLERETTTNNEGFFAFPNLPIGQYQVKINAQGFAQSLSTAIALEVGQTANLSLTLQASGPTEVVTLDELDNRILVNTTSAVVDDVITSREINSLPLNGRNFLELALLIPGNSLAPNFDPTKTNTVVVSSAGQLGRGGNVTIDGADNNDDMVGGAVQNVSQDAVEEFQIATNRFSAELGRSGSSVINIVTKSGTNETHGSASFYFRHRNLQGLPAPFDRTLGQEPPFEREQYSFTLGGPIKKDKAWYFGSFEYRDQDGAVLVGTRDLSTRTIRRGFALAPLRDLLTTLRADWQPTDADRISLRYSFQRDKTTSASTLDRAIGSASQRQAGINRTNSFLTNWSRVISPYTINNFNFSVGIFVNQTNPVTPGPQYTFPSIQDGASFRVPQGTTQRRLQFSDVLTHVTGNHTLKFGGEFQRLDGAINLEVFQQGRVEMIEDFPDFDRNGDGKVDDNDLLFAVTLRSGVPDRPLVLPDVDNNYFAAFIQDDWRVHPQLTLNLGLRYEADTDVKNVSRVGELNPLILPFLKGTRGRDANNFAPRFGFNYATKDGKTSIHGGYGVYYDRVTLEVQTLERGLDGRALPIEVRAGNVFFIDPDSLFDPAKGAFPPPAPTLANPFTGFVLPGAGAGGISIIDNDLQNPLVQQMNLGVQREIGGDYVVRVDYVHNFGTHFIIGRAIGTVFNPVVGGPDVVKNLESSVKTKYDGMLVSLEKRFSQNFQFRSSYTLSKAYNYANDDQIPFSNGPTNSNNLQLEYGPTPNDQRHRFTFAGALELPRGFRLSPILTLASGVPMDILLPDASSRIPILQRNAGGRLFHNGGELNAFLTQLNAAGGASGQPLPLAPNDARFNDAFSSLDMRLSKVFALGDRARLEPIVEVFNLFNVTNVLGFSNRNFSGFGNVLGSPDFGRPVTTAGGFYGSGGPRAFQLAARFTF